MALDRFRSQTKSPDYVYIGLALALAMFGFVMIASSSVVVSQLNYGNSYGFLLRQVVAFVLGLIGAIIVTRIHYDRWRVYAAPFFVITLILLLLLFVPHIGIQTNGAARWINLGLFQLQPSEILKLSSLVYFSAWLERRYKVMKRIETMIVFICLLIPIVALMMLQRDLGTLLVILLTLGLLFFAAGASYSQIGIGLVAGILLVVMLIVIEPYRLQRLVTFRDTSSDTLGAGYQINQAYLAIGSGGWWGRGYGKSIQKYLYLPEPQTDSIFAITVEELGFVRSMIVIIVIGAFAYRGYRIANQAPDVFGRYLAFGLTSMLLFQAVINIGAMLGLIPLTGVPLPFISYGGTSIVSSMIAVGIMANISRYRHAA